MCVCGGVQSYISFTDVFSGSLGVEEFVYSRHRRFSVDNEMDMHNMELSSLPPFLKCSFWKRQRYSHCQLSSPEHSATDNTVPLQQPKAQEHTTGCGGRAGHMARGVALMDSSLPV